MLSARGVFTIIFIFQLMKKINILPSLAILCLSLFLTNCGIKQTAVNATAQIMSAGTPAMEEEEDVAYANQASLASLKTMEAIQRSNPNDPGILLLLARSFASYTFGFVENDILEAKGNNEAFEKLATDRAKRFYGRGKKFGLLLLSQKGNFKKTVVGPLDEFKKTLNGFGKQDVPALFWTAFNWGNLINFSKDSPEAIIELPKVEAMIRRVMELDDRYNFSGPHLFLAVFNASRPAMLGGQPEEAKKEFDIAIEQTGGKYYIAKVLEAQFYAVQTQNKGLFESLLKEVVSADPAAMPEQRLANELAIRRAQILLQKEKLFFN